MDDADRAGIVLEKEEEMRRKQRASIIKVSSADCVECGDTISKERQKATGGTDMCIYCKQDRELIARSYGG